MTTPSDSVSVVIPTYNRSGFLVEAIDSVYGQSVPPMEVIVVDDGSTDDTESVLRQISARGLSGFQWVAKENGGPASARNLGVRIATGTYLAFLDSDDVWRRQKLERQLAQLAREPDLTLSFTAISVKGHAPHATQPPSLQGAAPLDIDVIDDLESGYCHPDWNSDPGFVLEELMSHSPIGSPSTVMVRREAIEELGGFSESEPVIDDWVMWLNMAAAGMRFGHIPERLVEYRVHPGNLSGDRLYLWNRITEMLDRFRVRSDLPRNVRRQVRIRWWCAHWHLIAALGELEAGNRARARRHILRAARIHPPSIRPGWFRVLAGVQPKLQAT
jgi:glycosyltransferase involved in cell wall biosynthesis